LRPSTYYILYSTGWHDIDGYIELDSKRAFQNMPLDHGPHFFKGRSV
jgi:hypothetical protein